ncbi:hypothetical protein MKEN_00433200 [Mycena kentingensis (nom. inval.)]|nr:hypothetical protein MKEN_00433200 [Mycena kentingensis (nom. inval.)]
MDAFIRRILQLLSALGRLLRPSLRTLFAFFSALRSRITKTLHKPTSAPKQHDYAPKTTPRDHVSFHEHKPTPSDVFLCPKIPVYIAASHVPTSLHPGPYLHPGPSGSRSSQDISAVPINEDSYSMHSLSVNHLPTAGPSHHPPSRPVSYLHPSAQSSVVNVHVPTESPVQTRPPSCDAVDPNAQWLNDAHPRILPGTPESFRRYKRNIIIPDELTNFNITPLTISITPKNPLGGWRTCLHPEGAPYFYHAEKRVYTDSNLFNPSVLDFMERNMNVILDFLRAKNVELFDNVDLVLDEYFFSDDSLGCQYYFVNHSSRCIFWMDHANSELFDVSEELNGITSASHIRHILEAQYWYSCEMFPESLHVTHAIVDELRDVVLHSMGDLITSEQSTVSWKVEDLNHIRCLVDGLTANVGKSSKILSGSSCLVGRLMHEFVRARIYNFHGEPGARLNVDQSIYQKYRRRTLLVKILSPLLFYAPDFQLDGLHKIYNDRLVRRRGWSEFVTRLTGEWTEFILYATVVLNANVAFLSIQSVDTNGSATEHRTATQISSYLSMITSIGTIIVGLLLLKQNRNRDRESAPAAAVYLFNRIHPKHGLETLAILYSLPYAMLIWSMVSFLAAFSFMCFEDADLKTRSLVAILWGAVAALVLWCIVNGWESKSDWTSISLLGTLFRRREGSQEEDGSEAGTEEKSRIEEIEEDAKSARSRQTGDTKRKKRRWWPHISLRKGSMDSEKTMTNV